MYAVFTTGGMIVDNVVSFDGTVHQGTLGGNGVYSAAGANLWLGQVGIVAVVPSNYPSQWLDAIRNAGIDTAGITAREASVECSEWFFYRSDGSRVDGLHAEKGFFEACGFKSDQLTPEQSARFQERLQKRKSNGLDFSEFRRLHPVRAIDIPGAYLDRGVHIAPGPTDAQHDLLLNLRVPGRVITLDPGSYATDIRTGSWPVMLPLLDALLPSEKELLVMAPGRSHANGLALLRSAGVPIAGVKLGAAGALIDDGSRSGPAAVPTLSVDAVDPTGAGDAFCGGFLAGLMSTGNALCATLCGTVAASFAVQSYGPFGLFSASQEEVIHRWRSLAKTCDLPNAETLLSQLRAMRLPHR